MDFVGPCLRIGSTLIAADVHLGYEDRAAGSSGLVTGSKAVLDSIVDLLDPSISRLVLNGDVLDDFSLKRIERRVGITRALRRLAEKIDLVLVRGNHDTMLETLHLDGPVLDSFALEDTLIVHGDRPITEDLEGFARVVIGHEHPVLALSDGLRLERFKCFVRVPDVSALGGREVIILPSAHPDVLGTDVTGTFRSPVISGSYPDAQVIVVGDPPRAFGTIGSLFTQE